MHKDSNRIIELKKQYIMPCLYHFYQRPPVMVKGDMQYLYDADGKQYTDFYAGVSVMNCGHNNPAIIEPVIQQIRTLQHTTTIYLTEPIAELAERVVAFMDSSLKKVFFVNSGTEANEGALLLSKLYTGKNGFIAFEGGLHGRTSLTMNLTGIDMWRTDPEIRPNIFFAPHPGRFIREMNNEKRICASLNAIEKILVQHNTIAACIIEPIQGNGGIIEAPDTFFVRLKELLARYGVLLIFDEVQTGFGRTGEPFYFKHTGIAPDILTCAKALGNGFPIGMFAASDEIAACYTRPGASTTGGNPVSAAAALAVLSYIEKNSLCGKARQLGEYLKSQLKKLQEQYPVISEVRGKGLMIGAELSSENVPLTKETDSVLEGLKDNGYLIGKTGINRNVLTFQPPLIISKDDIDGLITALERQLAGLCIPSAL
ncbi:aspartate aminotransferase family protein [bacterium]|nr:aspartate aminotransferase family protein [bacterium]MCP5462261.1 aspartate aminotransferase family protein [bacterium]